MTIQLRWGHQRLFGGVSRGGELASVRPSCVRCAPFLAIFGAGKGVLLLHRIIDAWTSYPPYNMKLVKTYVLNRTTSPYHDFCFEINE